MTFNELRKKMKDFNAKNGITRKVEVKDGVRMVGRVVIKNEVLVKEFPIEERTYEFDNYNKALTSADLGYSIFAFCKADNDCMRIENFENKDIESAEIVSVEE